MALIKYIGGAHFRELLKSDFAKVGVEVEHALTFAQHEIVEVANDVADAIHELAGDEFHKVEDDVDKELVRNAAEDPQPANMVPGAYVPQVAESDNAEVTQQPMPAPNPGAWVTKEQQPQTGSPAQVEGEQSTS